MSDSVIRYVITYKRPGESRTLIGPAQGRNTYATPEEALALLQAMHANNPRSLLASVYGDPDSLQVRACECYPVHFDPIGRYFDEVL
jgi:hypothetical protein